MLILKSVILYLKCFGQRFVQRTDILYVYKCMHIYWLLLLLFVLTHLFLGEIGGILFPHLSLALNDPLISGDFL